MEIILRTLIDEFAICLKKEAQSKINSRNNLFILNRGIHHFYWKRAQKRNNQQSQYEPGNSSFGAPQGRRGQSQRRSGEHIFNLWNEEQFSIINVISLLTSRSTIITTTTYITISTTLRVSNTAIHHRHHQHQGTINCAILGSWIGGSGDPRRKWESERGRERESIEKCCFCLPNHLKGL